MDTQRYIKVTELWVRTVVVGLNLCPFAREPLLQGRIRYQVCMDSEPEEIYRALLLELDALLDAPEQAVETSLLIVPYGLRAFETYLGLLDSAEQAVTDVGLEGILQLASFHPDYCFAGVDRNDPANYTNRSPYPMFHLLREASLERVLANYPEPERIPLGNIEKLRKLGLAELQRRLRLCR
ncbi:MAG: DUF1415 domain-containing protein [Gammaproteobacteria bacterium]|nr:DUF1415 domain-containing protein [Gammaproteobacteria bacterium]